jgi:hypothetical protein
MEQTLGARLRAQREQRQVALAAIAEETKIKLTLLEGLERDDLSRWPGGLFRRAYVRTYAQKIGLDPEQVLRDFLACHPDPVEPVSPVEAVAQNATDKRPRTRIGLMFAGLAARRPQRADVRHQDVAPGTLSIEHHVPTALQDIAMVDEPPQAVRPELPMEGSETVAPAPKLVKISAPEAGLEPRRDLRLLERCVAVAARLCTQIACVRDDQDLDGVLEDAVAVLGACGVILWIWDPDRDALFPALAHGYPAELVARLPEVDRRADNAIAAAFCFGQRQIVRGGNTATGAVVVPLLTPDGCVGTLALEFANGGEQRDLVQSLATIFTAQLSTLFSAPPAAADQEEDWTQQGRSLVAS